MAEMSGILGAVLFWSISMPMNYSEMIGQEMRAQTGRIEVANRNALVRPFEHPPFDEDGRIIFPHHLPKDPPNGLVTLHIARPGFTPDFLHDGLYLVSAAWREAARLTEDEARYFDVDASTSLPEVQAKDYKVLWPIAMRDWIDLERAGIREYPAGSGLRSAERPFFRTDIEVDVDIFYTPHFGDPFVTEALAARLTAAGLSVEFRDRTWGGYTGDLMDLPPGTMPPLRGN